MSEDYYRLLGAERRASREALKCAFRDRLKHVHPDHNPDDPLAVDRTRQLVEAYKVLRNPVTRRKYDAMPAPNAPLFRLTAPTSPTISPIFSRFVVVMAFVLVGLLAAAIAGAFTGGYDSAPRVDVPGMDYPDRRVSIPRIVEPLVWDSMEWYYAQRYQLSLADAGVAWEVQQAYCRAIERASAAGDAARVRFYTKAIRACQDAQTQTTAWSKCLRSGSQEISSPGTWKPAGPE